MSLSLLRCRVSQQLSRIPTLRNLNNFRRFFSTNPSVFSTPKPKQPKRNGILSAIKVGVFATFTSVFGAAGYATYAYTLEEVDTKTKKFRASSYSTEDDASTIKKLPSTVVSAPAKAIDLYLDLRKSIEDLVRSYSQPLSDKLLPDLPPHLENKIITLVVDLNETLVHSDWKRERGWRTFKRPGVDDFLEQLAQHYEIVVYTDTLQMYVDPVLERLDKKECIAHRLSRAATLYKDGKHYRDLSKLNRDPRRVIYVSGHALEQCLQPEHCVEIKPWTTDDVNDTTLLDLIPFLEFVALSRPPDIRKVLTSYPRQDIVKEFKERSNKKQGGMQQQQGRSWW